MKLTLPIFVLLIAATTPVAAMADGKLEKEFQTIYDRQARLVLKRDVAGLMEYNRPEYYVRLLDSTTVSRDSLAQRMTAFFTSGQLVRTEHFQYLVKDAKQDVAQATVLVEQRDKRIQIRKDGMPHEVEANVLHRDTWALTDQGWRRLRTEEVKQLKFTVDGKPK